MPSLHWVKPKNRDTAGQGCGHLDFPLQKKKKNPHSLSLLASYKLHLDFTPLDYDILLLKTKM